jgi:hypothetical protein
MHYLAFCSREKRRFYSCFLLLAPCSIRRRCLKSKVEHLRFGRQIDQVRAAVQDHVGEESRLVYLTGVGARYSDADLHLVFHEVGQVIIWAVACAGF